MNSVDLLLASKIINLLGAVILVTTYLQVSYQRLDACVGAYRLHSFLLALLAAVVAFVTGFSHLYIAAILTFAIKTIFIPAALNRIIKQINIKREVELYINIPSSLLIAGGLTILAYYVTQPIIGPITLLTRNCMAVSIAVILIGFFIMTARVKAISQIIGLLTLENGVFLGAIATTYGMPLIIETGIFFDILMGVLILIIFLNRINKTFVSLSTKNLDRLKG